MTHEPTVLSLFSGVGGLDLGLHRAGWRHVGFCESEPYRRSVLAHHWPGVPVFDDVATIDLSAWTGGLGAGSGAVGGGHGERSPDASRSELSGARVDLVAGGSPCQDLSVAGKRRGLAGARSGLFFEYARVVDAVRPRWFLFENVPGLFSSHGGRDFGIVLETMAELGYGMAWRVLDSRFFGVPQRRRRVFIVGAVADGDPRAAAERAGQVLAVGTRCPRHPATRGEARPDIAVASLSGPGTGGPDDNDGQAGRIVSYALNCKRGNRDDGESETFVTHALTSTGHDASEDGSGRGTPLIAGPLGGDNDGIGRSSEDDPNLVTRGGVRRLTPTECERLQAWPDGWTNPDGTTADSPRYAACGDGVTASVSEWIGRRMLAHVNVRRAA